VGYLVIAVLAMAAGGTMGWFLRRRVDNWCVTCHAAVGSMCAECRDRLQERNRIIANAEPAAALRG